MTTLPPQPELIETMRVLAIEDNTLNVRIPLIHFHLQRLKKSAILLNYSFDISICQNALLTQLARLNTRYEYRLRLSLSLNGRLQFQHSVLQPLTHPQYIRIAPEILQVSAEMLQHKLSPRPWYQTATAQLEHATTLFDYVFFNKNGILLEGSRSNVYIKNQANQWLTPHIEDGCLPGVYRQHLLDQGFVQEAHITYDDFINARSYRLSNALRAWFDVNLLN